MKKKSEANSLVSAWHEVFDNKMHQEECLETFMFSTSMKGVEGFQVSGYQRVVQQIFTKHLFINCN